MPSVDLGDWNAESVDHDPFAQPPAAPDDSGVTPTSDPLGSSVTVAKDQTPPAPDDAPKLAGHVAAQQEPGQLLTPKYLAAHPQGTLGAYNPSWAEDIQQGVSNLAERAGVPTEGAERMAGTVRAGAEMAPITGNILSGNEAYRDADRGDLWSAALHTAMALPIPGASAEEGAARRVVSDSGFYSHAADIASQLKQETGTVGQFNAQLLKSGVKPEEIARSGISKLPPDAKITKDDLVAGFNKALPPIQETQLREGSSAPLDPATIEAHARANYEAGGEGRWEDLNPERQQQFRAYAAQTGAEPKFQDWSSPGGQNYRELLLHLPNALYDESPEGRARILQYGQNQVNFSSGHWDQYNVLAHLRMMDRQGEDGQNLLHLDELQSDWGQKTRAAQGMPQLDQDAHNYPTLYDNLADKLKEQNIALNSQYGRNGQPDMIWLRQWGADDKPGNRVSPEALDPETRAMYDRVMAANERRGQTTFRYTDPPPPPGPFVGSTSGWTDLGLKRALTEAARGNYDGMIWTPGQEQADRYGLEKHFSTLMLHDNDSGGIGRPQMEGPFRSGNLVGRDHNGREIVNQWVDENQLRAHVGDEVADRLLAQEPTEARSAGIGVRQRQLSGLDLRTGGEGMKDYYDNILPKRLQQATKKLDPSVKIGRTNVPDPNFQSQIDPFFEPYQNHLGHWMVGDSNGISSHESFHPDEADAQREADAINSLRRAGGFSTFETENMDTGEPMFGVDGPNGTVNYHPTRDAAEQEAARLNVNKQPRQPPPLKSYPYIPITPLMRERILKGLPQYAEGGAVADAPDETTLEPVDHDPFAGLRGDGLGGQTDPDQFQLAARQPEATPSSAGGSPMSAQDREALIRTVYGEASDQPDLGKAGVAHAILNRVAAGGYGDSIHDVVMAPAAGVDPKRGFHEFSPWNPPGVPEGNPVAQRLSPDSKDPNQAAAYRHIGDIVDKVYSGLIPDPTHGATHYYGYMPRPPKWAAPLAKQNMVKIGGQTFVGGSTGPGQSLPSQITGGLQDIGAGAT